MRTRRGKKILASFFLANNKTIFVDKVQPTSLCNMHERLWSFLHFHKNVIMYQLVSIACTGQGREQEERKTGHGGDESCCYGNATGEMY